MKNSVIDYKYLVDGKYLSKDEKIDNCDGIKLIINKENVIEANLYISGPPVNNQVVVGGKRYPFGKYDQVFIDRESLLTAFNVILKEYQKKEKE